MQPYNRLTIDLTAVRKNIEISKKNLPDSGRVMAMVKASAYGTDAFMMTKFLKAWGYEIVGVSHVAEGVELRQKGCDLSIFVIYSAPFEAGKIVEYDLEVSVADLDFCRSLNDEAIKRGKKVKVHLDICTGMRRFGCREQEALPLAIAISKLPGLHLEGVMTHFIAAENPEFDTLSKEQFCSFERVLANLNAHGLKPPWIHAANSSGALRFALPSCNMVRVGAALFGLYSSEEEKKEISLVPALTLESCIVALNDCTKGDTVGYSQSYTVKRDVEKIAILPIGYHDGLHVQNSGKGFVLIHGKKAPYVGKICMDFMMVDVTEIPEARIGDTAVIFGKDLPVEVMAGFVKTNVRQVVVCLGPRVERVFAPELTPLRSLYKNESAPLKLSL